VPVCFCWNEGASCKYSHVCRACRGPHRKVECRRAKKRSNLFTSSGLCIYCSCWTANSCHSSVLSYIVCNFIVVLFQACFIAILSWGVKGDLRSTSHVPLALPQDILTPLKANQWSKDLLPHPDQQFRSYLVQGITSGFRIGFNRSFPLQSASKNLYSSNPAIISNVKCSYRDHGEFLSATVLLAFTSTQ